MIIFIFQNVESNQTVYLGTVHVCQSVFTLPSWGVGSHDVLSELNGPAVIPPERNMEADKRIDLCTPPKDKRDRDKRLKPHNHLTIYNGQAPVTSRIRGDLRTAKPAVATGFSASHYFHSA